MRQIEAPLTVIVGPVVQPVIRLATRIQHHKWHIGLTLHHLQRLLSMADKTAAQHVMGVYGRLPGGLKTRHIQPAYGHAKLIDVMTRVLFEQAVKQHALLHRCQRVNVLNVAGRHRQTIELRLTHAGQRKVRRRDALMPGQTMFDQRSQGLLVTTRQRVDGRGLVLLATEGPVHLQLAVEHLAVEAQTVGQRAVLVERDTRAV